MHNSAGANGLAATNVRSIVLRDSPGLTRLALTSVGRVIREDRGVGGVLPFTKNGRVSDADFKAPPPIGTIAADLAGKKLYLRTVDGWVAGPAMAASTDALLALTNVTPATGTLDAGDTYRKTGGDATWGNCTATLPEDRSGSFRLRVKFFDVTAPAGQTTRAAIAGILPISTPLNATPTHDDFTLGVYQEGAKIYLKTGGSLPGGPYAYTSGQECELTTNVISGVSTLKINGVQVFSANLGANPALQHRFSSALYGIGSKFQLLEYGPV
jgi:hypothetical protein